MEGDAVEGTVVCVGRKEVLQAMNLMKTIEVSGFSEVSLNLIADSGGVGILVKAKIYQSPRLIWNAS